MKYLFFAILIYLAYQFIFFLVIPVYKATRTVKKGFRDMHQRMQEQQASPGQTHQQGFNPSGNSANPKPGPGDYLEFEEVK